MDTPPPPPLRHYRTPSNSPFEVQTPNTGRSRSLFGSMDGSPHYSNYSYPRTHSMKPKIETREPAYEPDHSYFDSIPIRPMSMSNTSMSSAMESTAGRDYLCFTFKKLGARWDETPFIEEIRASQAEIKRKAESRSGDGSVISQMQKMGPKRREQINKHAMSLNDAEYDGSRWEPVYMSNIKTRTKDLSMEVLIFEVIFARQQPRAESLGMEIPPILPLGREPEMPNVEYVDDKVKRRKSRSGRSDKAAHRTSMIIDDFSPLFDASGAPIGDIGSVSRDLPKSVALERPNSTARFDGRADTAKPRIVQGLNPDERAFNTHGLGRNNSKADDILRNLPSVIIDDDKSYARERKPSRRTSMRESKDGVRRSSNRHSVDLTSGKVRFSEYLNMPNNAIISSSSSVTSADNGRVFDEVEEISSYTSGDSSSAGAKKHRRPGPTPIMGASSYEYVTNDRKRSSRHADKGKAKAPLGEEQGFTGILRRLSSKKKKRPTVHQESYPAIVPPEAIYPHEFRDRSPERRLQTTYMQPSTLEDDMEGLRLGREFGGLRRAYTHEPRNSYISR